MKKILALAVVAAAAAAACAPASAQSSVTVFGVLDMAARNVKNGDNSINSLASGGASTSRLGVRGVEDLGDGLKAGFWLESTINGDTGTTTSTTTTVTNADGSKSTVSTGSRFWDRRSTVSLSGNFGEVRLGRDSTPTYLGWSDYDVFGVAGVGNADKYLNSAAAKLGTAVDTQKRADNQISYFLPSNLGGFYGQVAVAAGEATAGRKYVGGRFGFATGPFDVSVSYGQTEVVKNAAGDDQYKLLNVGGSYDFQVVKVLGAYSEAKYGNQKLDVADLGVLVPFGPGAVRVAYMYANAKGNGTDANDSSQIALGYLYDMSKRTSLYATAARVNNKGLATYVVDSNPAIAGGQDSTGVEFGIRHRF